MPEQTQIFAGSIEAAPKDYTVAANVELRLVAVNASFTDNGAGVDWLPAVVLISDSGHVIARATDQAVKVIASNDAAVSWFPGVKNVAATASASAVFPYAQGIRSAGLFGDSAYTVPAGSSKLHPFPHTTVYDSSVFTFATSVGTNDELQLNKNGCYIVQVSSEWENTNFFHYGQVEKPNSDLDVHGESPGNAFTASLDPTGAAVWTTDISLVVVSSAPEITALRVFNGDVAARNVRNATIDCVYLGPA